MGKTVLVIDIDDFRLSYQQQRERVEKLLRGYHVDIVFYASEIVVFKDTNLYKELTPYLRHTGRRMLAQIYPDYYL